MHFNKDANCCNEFLISSKFSKMDSKQTIIKLQELIGLHKLSMNQNLKAAIRVKSPIYKNFYEETAFEKMDLINQLQWRIESISNVSLRIPLQTRILSWKSLVELDDDEISKAYLDTHEEALYFCYDLLTKDLLFSVSKTLNEQVHQLETTLITYGYLKRHI